MASSFTPEWLSGAFYPCCRCPIIAGWASSEAHKIANVNVNCCSFPHKALIFFLFNDLLLLKHNFVFLDSLSHLVLVFPASKFFKVSKLLYFFLTSSSREKIYNLFLLFLHESWHIWKITQPLLLNHFGTLFPWDMQVTGLGKEQMRSLWVPCTPSKAQTVHWEGLIFHQWEMRPWQFLSQGQHMSSEHKRDQHLIFPFHAF